MQGLDDFYSQFFGRLYIFKPQKATEPDLIVNVIRILIASNVITL